MLAVIQRLIGIRAEIIPFSTQDPFSSAIAAEGGLILDSISTICDNIVRLIT